jgi:hypothetical protein
MTRGRRAAAVLAGALALAAAASQAAPSESATASAGEAPAVTAAPATAVPAPAAGTPVGSSPSAPASAAPPSPASAGADVAASEPAGAPAAGPPGTPASAQSGPAALSPGSPAPEQAGVTAARPQPARATLLPLAQPLWSDLGAAQRQVLAPFESQWNALPLEEKRAWADLARRFPRMRPEEQTRIERRIAEWAALTPEERRIARRNYRLARQLPAEDRLADWERYQAMTPDQRTVLNEAGASRGTAARQAAAPTGLAKEAAQPLPRRAPVRPPVAAGGQAVPSTEVAPTVGVPSVPAAPR